MKNILHFIIVGLFFTLIACNSGNETGAATDSASVAEPAHKPLTFVTKKYTQQTTQPCDHCPEVEVSVPIAEGDSAIAQKINDSVFAVVQSVLGWENKHADNYDSLLANFIKMYEETIAVMSKDAAIGWSGTVNESVVKQTDKLVNIMLDTYTMTGGAHGNANKISLLFDPATGNKLSLNDVLKDTAGFTALAETAFRKKLDIPAGKSINATMFTFTNNKFALPGNIFFMNDSLLLHYNPYEIGPYAIGVTEVTIPYTAAQPFMAVEP